MSVFICFAGAGYYIWRGFKQRKVFFENLLAFCNHLLIEISFSKHTIKHIIETYGSTYGVQFQAMLQGYQNFIDQKQDITRECVDAIVWRKLKPQERAVVADFFYELGRHGSFEEAEKVENKKIQFDNFFRAADTALRKDASIYLKIFILLGVGAVILLL